MQAVGAYHQVEAAFACLPEAGPHVIRLLLQVDNLIVEDNLRQLGLNVVIATDRTIADIYAAMATLGRATGHQAEAEKLAASTRKDLAEIAQRVASLPRVRAIVIVDRGVPGDPQTVQRIRRRQLGPGPVTPPMASLRRGCSGSGTARCCRR